MTVKHNYIFKKEQKLDVFFTNALLKKVLSKSCNDLSYLTSFIKTLLLNEAPCIKTIKKTQPKKGISNEQTPCKIQVKKRQFY